ncbi:MAG: PEP-CTERM sorting domain-containing protein [Gemmatimonadaceae bacterium]|nr:PEP-CTERM sorting domain-containing protein [Gemmatimonadaceae bacterium]
MKRTLRLAAAAMLATSTAGAQTLLLDTFDAENGGNSALNYATFGQWNVVGAVDLVKSGDFGISCVGGVGACVDLSGTASSSGSLISKTAFSFSAGDLVGVSFMASGNQRGYADDLLNLTLNFSSSTTFASYAVDLGGAAFSGGPLLVGGGYGVGRLIGSSEAFSLWTIQFVAANAGSFTVGIGTTSDDNVGPMIDDVNIGIAAGTVVPEPATWTLMLSGLGMLGVAARRRRKA